MYHLIFTLSMPHRASWNNKWSGEGIKYVRSRSFYKKDFEALPPNIIGNHRYRWDDGWEANVNVKLVKSAKEKNKIIHGSAGFCGYDWMINSLLKNGRISYETH